MKHDTDKGSNLYDNLNLLPEAILIINQAGKVEFANHKAIELFGADSGFLPDIKIKVPRDVKPPFEQEFTLPGDEKITTQIKLSEIKWGNKKAYLSHLHDITQEKLSLEALANSKEIFRQVTQSSSDAICMADENGEILFFNLAAEKLFKVPAQDIIGTDIHMILPIKGQELIDSMLQDQSVAKVRVNKKPVISTIRASDGTEIQIELIVKCFLISERKVILVIFTDISPIVTAENQIKNLSFELEKYQEQISHLTSKNKEYREHIHSLENENQQSTDLINKLEMETEHLHTKLITSEKQHEQVKQQFVDLSNDFSIIQQRLSESTQEITTLNKNISIITSERDRLDNDLGKSQTNLAQIQDSYTFLQKELSQKNQQLEHIQTRCDEQEKDLAFLTADRNHIQQSLDLTMSNYDQTSKQLDTMIIERNKLMNTISEISSEKEQLFVELSSLRNHKELIENQLSNIIIERKQLIENLDKLTHDHNDLNIEIAKLIEERDKANEQIRLSKHDFSALKEKHNFLESIVQTLPDLLLIVGENGEIVWYNNSFSNISGMLRQDIIGKDIRQFSVKYLAPQLTEQFWHNIFEKKAYHLDGIYENAASQQISWKRINIKPISTSHDEPLRLLIHIRDITAEKTLEDEINMLRNCSQALTNIIMAFNDQYKFDQLNITKTPNLLFSQSNHSPASSPSNGLNNIQNFIFKKLLEAILSLKGFNGAGLYHFNSQNDQYLPLFEKGLQNISNLPGLFTEIEKKARDNNANSPLFFDVNEIRSLLSHEDNREINIKSLAWLPFDFSDEKVVLILVSSEMKKVPLYYQSAIQSMFNHALILLLSDRIIENYENRQQKLLLAANSFLSGDKWQTDSWFVFKEFGKSVNANRIYIYQFRTQEKQNELLLIQEWTDGKTVMRSKQPVFYKIQAPEHISKYLFDQLKEKNFIKCTQGQVPSDIWDSLADSSTHSFILFPIIAFQSVWGILGIDFSTEAGEITPTNANTLQTIALLLGISIQKQVIKDELSKFHNRFEDIVKEKTNQLNNTCEILNKEIDFYQQVEKKRQENEMYLRSIFYYASQAYIIINKDYIIQDINKSAEELSKNLFKTELCTNSIFLDYINDTDKDRFKSNINMAFNGKTTNIETAIDDTQSIDNDHEKRWFAICFQPVFYQDQEVPFVSIHIQEISDYIMDKLIVENEKCSLIQKINEQTADLSYIHAQLARSARTKDRFLSNISHNLRMPLNTILSNSDTLLEEVYGPVTPRQQQSLSSIIKSGKNLLDSIDDILELTQINAGSINLELRPTNIQEMCNTCISSIKESATKKNISIQTSVDKTIKEISIDNNKILQTLEHLLSNAVKFTAEGGEIGLELSGDVEEYFVRFTVWDSGAGIKPEYFSSMFKPFSQMENDFSQTFEGSGLGMALAYHIVDLHGGSIGFESEPGKGNRFTIQLPWYFPSCASSNSQTHQQTISSSQIYDQQCRLKLLAKFPTILIAEDNEFTISGFSDCLLAEGFQVLLARSGNEIIDRINNSNPALIVMDLELPDMEGIKAIERIRKENINNNIPIIALTSLSMPGDDLRVLQAGASSYFRKPIHHQRLLSIIWSIYEDIEENNKVDNEKT